MKFPTGHATGEIQGSQKKACGCYLASTKLIRAQVEGGARREEWKGPRTAMSTPWPHEEIRSRGREQGYAIPSPRGRIDILAWTRLAQQKKQTYKERTNQRMTGKDIWRLTFLMIVRK
ncbi:hypothetical protein LIER_29611 [Lithospermum erythrorhizon]|uniref:Uncharacterized protein n=1 Tax=Lithospermum erythrorhizon TaxID=34254 RepID=A0AAV3RMQ3_LITER